MTTTTCIICAKYITRDPSGVCAVCEAVGEVYMDRGLARPLAWMGWVEYFRVRESEVLA